MNNKTNCDQIHEHIEAYALGILDSEIAADVHEHLANCQDCRQLVVEYESIVNDLPYALARVSPHELPPQAKQNLMARIDQIQTNHQPTTLLPKRTPQRQPMFNLRRYAILVLNMIVVVSLALTVYLGVALANERNLRMALEHRTELIFEIVDSDRTERAFLAAVDRSDGETLPPYGKIFKRTDMPFVVAMTGRLPQPPAGQAYNLWLFSDESAERAGEILVDDMGFGAIVYDSERVDPNYQRAQVILQSQDSATPTGTTILNWEAE